MCELVLKLNISVDIHHNSLGFSKISIKLVPPKGHLRDKLRINTEEKIVWKCH
jgi:hypothetical protein